VETDGSEYVIGGILSQIDRTSRILHPIAYYSHSLHSAELNYDIYDKELLGIFEAFCQWRAYLEGTYHKILVISDHNNLRYFTTTKQLSPRQARWSEYLSSFNYIVKHCPGRLGTKPDTLSHCPNLYPKGESRAYAQANPHNFSQIFKEGQLAVIVMDAAAITI
jgi:hypothetical protein